MTPDSKNSGADGEKILGIIPNASRTKMFGLSRETFTLLVTDKRMILAQLTPPMLKAAVAEAQAKAKAEGKGLLGIMGDQMAAQFQYAKRYEGMVPDAVLAETPGNTAIGNESVTAVDLRLHDEENAAHTELGLAIRTATGKIELRIAEDERFIACLKAAYGDRVHLPAGYPRFGGVRIKLF